MPDPRCPACGGTRQWFPDDAGVIVHADNGCPLCDVEGRSWGGVLEGDVLTRLAELRPGSVSCFVTSPPYWSLRKYDAGDVVWGGEAGCEHRWSSTSKEGATEAYAGAGRWQHEGVSRQETPDAWTEYIEGRVGDASTLEGGKRTQIEGKGAQARGDWQRQTRTSDLCSRCGAWRGSYGLEPTIELYIEHTIQILRAIRRVLRPDGLVWWNIDDSRARNAKCLDLIPQRIMLACEADGWLVCSENIWSKPNAMPESAKKRPTDSHEKIILLAKNGRNLYWYHPETGEMSKAPPRKGRWQEGLDWDWREVKTGKRKGRQVQRTRWVGVDYWWDQEAVREPQSENTHSRGLEANTEDYWQRRGGDHAGWKSPEQWLPSGRNLRSVWVFPTAQTPEAHFATFPPELPRRCIEAACPREICAKCGTARVRLVETKAREFRREPAHAPFSAPTKVDSTGWEPPEPRTIGWSSCPCPEPDYQPGIVLDPFAGVGTTLYVARQLGRRFLGIELSESYAEMARTKLQTWWAPGNLAPRAAQAGQEKLPEEV